MAIIKNPFRKQDENVRPQLTTHQPGEKKEANGVKHIDVDSKEPVEYKLSEVNDSGVFMPPSPTEKKSFWGTTASRSTTSSSLHRCAFDENEPFNISRESFDSYRRSFDISARSPIIQPMEGRPRASLDSRTFVAPPRSSNSYHRPLQVPQTQEEDKFEDVNIDDPKPQPKKKGLFTRMADSIPGVGNDSERPVSQDKGSSWHHFGNRKRAESGRGAELGSMPILPKRDETPKPEKQQQRQERQIAPPAADAPVPAPVPAPVSAQATEPASTTAATAPAPAAVAKADS